MMLVINGGCHCGTIRYDLTWPLPGPGIPARACSCEFCTKHRGTYTSHPEAKLEAVIADESMLSAYSFATGTAEFSVCRRCGVVPFVTSRIDGRLYAVVNVNTFENGGPLALTETVSDFDGESVEERLARRAGTWIPRVSIEYRESRAE